MPGDARDDTADTGLACLLLISHYHGIAAEPAQVAHSLGLSDALFSMPDIVRAARRLGLRASAVTAGWSRLQRIALPAIGRFRSGGFFVLAGLQGDKVLLHDPHDGRPTVVPRPAFEARWDGELILVARRVTAVGDVGRFGLRWFLPIVAKYRALFAEVIVAAFFLQLFALITPLFFQVIVDKVLVHRGVTTLDVLMIGMIILAAFEVLLSGLRTYLFSHTTNRVDAVLGARVFDHLVHLPLAYFSARRVGDSVARIRELENIRQFLTGSALTLLIDLFFTIVFFAVLYHYSPWLTAIVAGALPVYLALSLSVMPMLRSRLEERFNRGAENQAFLVETITGIETIKSMGIEPQAQRRWEDQLAGYIGASFRTTQLANIASQSAALIDKLTMALVLWAGATQVMQGALSVGQLIAFNMIAARISAPVLRLVQLWQDFQQAGVSLRRLGDVLDAPVESAQRHGRSALPEIRGDVVFEHLRFRYSADRPLALDGIDRHVPAGQIVGIVGRSGSGKSTLAKLLQRLYVAEAGRVLVDGVDLAMVDPGWLRRRIGVVLQDSFLFNRSIRDNIAIADPGMDMARVIRAAELAGAHEFILELPLGYDTPVGEHGSRLSGGQRQRIAIARALAGDPSILIFDEATSALDYESERRVRDNMHRICAGRTVFIIAHRMTALRHADRLWVMDRGRVVEDGSHAELIAAGGAYARLYAMQTAAAPDDGAGAERKTREVAQC